MTDFKQDDIEGFYSRVLYSLSVPHTVSDIRLVADTSASQVPVQRSQSSQSVESLKFRQQQVMQAKEKDRAFKWVAPLQLVQLQWPYCIYM